jgi:O-antigen/teichoic acid export membrane protein
VYQFILHKIRSNRSSLFLFAGSSLLTVLNFVIISFLSHTLPVHEYGTYRHLLTFISIGVALGSLGFAQSCYYFLSAASGRQEKYDQVNVSRFLVVGGALLACLLMYACSGWFVENFDNLDFNRFTWFAFALIFFSVLQTIELNVFVDAGLMSAYFMNTIINVFMRLALLYYLYMTGKGFEAYLYTLLILAALQTLVNQLFIQVYYKGLDFSIRKGLLRKQLYYAAPIGLGLFFGVLMNNTDRMVLSSLVKDVKDFAVMANGNFEVPFISGIYIAFSTMALPAMIKAYQAGEYKELNKVRKAYMKQIAPLLFPVVFMLIYWSKPIILLVFGPKYPESAALFAVFSLTYFIRFCSHTDIFYASGRTRYIILIQVVEFFLNILFCILFIRWYGAIGASYAIVLTNALYFIVVSAISAGIVKSKISDLYPSGFLLTNLAVCVLALFITHFIFDRFFHVSSYLWIPAILFYWVLYSLLFFAWRRKRNEEI